jgi:hypothetical protein
MKRWFLIAATATLFAAAPHPHALASTDTDFRTARETFNAARAGKVASSQVVTQFSALLERDPANPLLAAYRAAAVVMQARDAWLPWNKMKYLDDGLADMDRALAMLKPQHERTDASGVPVASTVRLVAANSFIAVPSFANRGAEGRRLVRSLIASDGFTSTPAAFRIAALELAISSSTDADASRALWERRLSELKPAAAVAQGAAQ